MKTKKKAVKKEKLYGIPIKTAASKSIKSLKWKLKEERPKGHCLKRGCSKVGVQGIFCKKHKKILRKEQLRLNNIPWRKKKVQANYKPKQMHLIYKGKATKATLADEKRARKRVKLGKSKTITSTKLLQKAIERAKQEMKESPKKVKRVKAKAEKVVSKKVSKVKAKKVHKKEKPAKRGKIALAMDEETIDLT